MTTACPHCSKVLKVSKPPEVESLADLIAICHRCLGFCVITSELGLRKPNEEEKARIHATPLGEILTLLATMEQHKINVRRHLFN